MTCRILAACRHLQTKLFLLQYRMNDDGTVVVVQQQRTPNQLILL